MKPQRRVAIVAFHFPPQGGAGSLRLLSFARHLPEHGWLPHVVTLGALKGGVSDATLVDRLPRDVDVDRWFTPLASWAYRRDARPRLDQRIVRRGLSSIASYPDPAILWSIATGMRLGRLLKRANIDVIMSSAPPTSSHAAALIARAMTGRPLVVDLRDPWESNLALGMAKTRYRIGAKLENAALRAAACVLANTPRLAASLQSREHPPRRVVTLPNGYDEFEVAEARAAARERRDPDTFTIVHAGAFYAGQRDPLVFLEALARARSIVGRDVRFQLPGDSSFHRNPVLTETISRLGLEGAVEFPGYVPHREALAMMAAADLLLIIQGPGFHLQVPSKAYEYLALGPPVLALSGEGATADLVRSSASGTVLTQADPESLCNALVGFLRGESGRSTGEPPDTVVSRQRLAAKLAAVLDEVAAPQAV